MLVLHFWSQNQTLLLRSYLEGKKILPSTEGIDGGFKTNAPMGKVSVKYGAVLQDGGKHLACFGYF